MTLAVLTSRALSGMAAPEVTVEVNLAPGLPAFNLVGLPDTEVKEARDRVRAAIQNCRYEFPQRRITVNLAPAELPKESGRFDLAIALGVLIASGQVRGEAAAHCDFAGELALGGELRAVRGALPMALAAAAAQRDFIVPAANAAEAALVSGARVLPAGHLLDVCAHLEGRQPLSPYAGEPLSVAPRYADLAEVKGQSRAKRALEVAAAGGHSLLMSGPPGSGKSMLASRFAGVLPPMTEAEALEAAAVHSLAGRFDASMWKQRPYRAPHHTASAAALVGGGGEPRPGEISLAHNGVLFLDELPEFGRKVLESLREPLETGSISISRAMRRADFPARFQLVAAMNGCPCGRLGKSDGSCRCTPDQVARYRSKLSGPFLDRIDLMIEVPALGESDLQSAPDGESSSAVRQRVIRARALQLERQGCANAALQPPQIEQHCRTEPEATALLQRAVARLELSARAYHRILRVARSIADLVGAGVIGANHIAEAVSYRQAFPEA
jgi:magnesium chelatase family protein